MEMGVAKGVRIALNADNEPSCRGASLEEALLHAEAKMLPFAAFGRLFGDRRKCHFIGEYLMYLSQNIRTANKATPDACAGQPRRERAEGSVERLRLGKCGFIKKSR